MKKLISLFILGFCVFMYCGCKADASGSVSNLDTEIQRIAENIEDIKFIEPLRIDSISENKLYPDFEYVGMNYISKTIYWHLIDKAYEEFDILDTDIVFPLPIEIKRYMLDDGSAICYGDFFVFVYDASDGKILKLKDFKSYPGKIFIGEVEGQSVVKIFTPEDGDDFDKKLLEICKNDKDLVSSIKRYETYNDERLYERLYEKLEEYRDNLGVPFEKIDNNPNLIIIGE